MDEVESWLSRCQLCGSEMIGGWCFLEVGGYSQSKNLRIGW